MSAKNNIVEKINNVEFQDALSERYLSYALSTIMSRSLPDVRDGLKPVHRRLLYAMFLLKLDPKSGFKKCARVVGDVIGKYHPHGDVAVYDTLVRLAQDFSLRYPLIEGQGNFGSIDGDNAAAMRYTESRLTNVALFIMEDIHSNTVNFRPTYDGEEEEPIVMPSAFPNLLANGSEGIAVGMATSIPSHNVAEICDALLKLIKNPTTSVAELMEFIKGPDFPTGGTILESHENLVKIYEQGKGSIRVRAKWEKEELSHGLYQIVVTEIPYQVSKAKLIEHIAELYRNKKLPLLGHIIDESAHDIRIVLEPKNRNIDPEILMESLFKLTALESRFNLNMNVLDANSIPKVMNLQEVLTCYLEHREQVLIRRSEFRLDKINHRLEVLDGFLIAYLNLDEVIRIIRNEDDPKAVMQKKWKLTDIQVESILNMKLRSLRKLEEFEIKQEYKQLSEEKENLEALLADEKLRKKEISSQIKSLKKTFDYDTDNGKRRTIFSDVEPKNISVSAEVFIEKEPITILCSKLSWIRSVKGHGDLEGTKYKEGDEEKYIIKAYTTDKIIFASTKGKFYTVIADFISKGKSHGDPLKLLFNMEPDEDIISVFVHDDDVKYLLVSNNGKGFIVNGNDLIAQTKNGKQIMSVAQDSILSNCIAVNGEHVAVIGTNRKLLVFPTAEIAEMKRGQGIALQKYKDAKLSDVKFFNLKEGLCWQSSNGRRYCEEDINPWISKRGGAGKFPPHGFPKNNMFND